MLWCQVVKSIIENKEVPRGKHGVKREFINSSFVVASPSSSIWSFFFKPPILFHHTIFFLLLTGHSRQTEISNAPFNNIFNQKSQEAGNRKIHDRPALMKPVLLKTLDKILQKGDSFSQKTHQQ